MIWVAVFRSHDRIESREFESMDAARAAFLRSDLQQLRVCTKCKHAECPCCLNWCDEIVGDDGDMCCEGTCVFAEPESFPFIEAPA